MAWRFLVAVSAAAGATILGRRGTIRMHVIETLIPNICYLQWVGGEKGSLVCDSQQQQQQYGT